MRCAGAAGAGGISGFLPEFAMAAAGNPVYIGSDKSRRQGFLRLAGIL